MPVTEQEALEENQACFVCLLEGAVEELKSSIFGAVKFLFGDVFETSKRAVWQEHE